MQEVKGIKKILYHFKAWFRSLSLSVYNVKLYREEETKYVHVLIAEQEFQKTKQRIHVKKDVVLHYGKTIHTLKKKVLR